MLDFLISQSLDPRVLIMFFAAVAAGATVLTLAMPYLATDTLDKRMKAVALEREKRLLSCLKADEREVLIELLRRLHNNLGAVTGA